MYKLYVVATKLLQCMVDYIEMQLSFNRWSQLIPRLHLTQTFVVNLDLMSKPHLALSLPSV